MTNHPNRGKVKNWPEYLKAFRTKHGLTQNGLADKLMIPASVVESWECGRYTPPPYLKIALNGPSIALRCQESVSGGDKEIPNLPRS